MEKNKDSKPDNKKGNKKPLKLSSSGRLQIRKNLGPTGNKVLNLPVAGLMSNSDGFLVASTVSSDVSSVRLFNEKIQVG